MNRVQLIALILLSIPITVWGVEKELHKAFAFGYSNYTRAVYNDASQDYIKIKQESNGSVPGYSAGQGYGYTASDQIDATPNDRSGYASCESLYESFIGAKIVDGGNGEIVFRVDVPNGYYQFVASMGDARYDGHQSSLKIRNGSDGNSTTLIDNVTHNASEFVVVGFDNKVHIPCSGETFLEQTDCPVIEVTKGYIEIIQKAHGGGGGDLNYIEVWNVNYPVTGVTIDQGESITIIPGETTNLTATVAPVQAIDKSVSWGSGTPSVASVGASSGTVTALTEGQTIITVTTTDGGKTDQITINVECPTMAAPTNFNATNGDGSVTLVWDPVADVDGYTIKYSTDPNDLNLTQLVADGSTNTITIDPLVNEIMYYFVIYATKNSCEGAHSGQVSSKPSAFIDEYYGPNIYISTVNSGKNLGSGINATKIDGQPGSRIGFQNYEPIGFMLNIVAPHADPDLDACMTFSFDPEDLPENINLASLALFKSDDEGTTWEKIGGIINLDNNTVKICNIDGFSYWTLAGSIPPDVPIGNWGIVLSLLLIGTVIIIKHQQLL